MDARTKYQGNNKPEQALVHSPYRVNPSRIFATKPNEKYHLSSTNSQICPQNEFEVSRTVRQVKFLNQ